MSSLGFYVEDNLPSVIVSFERFKRNLNAAIIHAFDEVAADMIEHAQDYTGKLRPPVYAGNPPRPAHPGNWADITTVLVQGFTYSVKWQGHELHFVFGNEVEYALYLEKKEGYWVIGGLYEGFFQKVLNDRLINQLRLAASVSTLK